MRCLPGLSSVCQVKTSGAPRVDLFDGGYALLVEALAPLLDETELLSASSDLASAKLAATSSVAPRKRSLSSPVCFEAGMAAAVGIASMMHDLENRQGRGRHVASERAGRPGIVVGPSGASLPRATALQRRRRRRGEARPRAGGKRHRPGQVKVAAVRPNTSWPLSLLNTS